MGLSDYLTGIYGIAHQGQYLYLFILSFNPFTFKLFRPRDYAILAIGVLFSLINHRAVLPFLLLIVLDLDYLKLDKNLKRLIFSFFIVMVFLVMWFGGHYV